METIFIIIAILALIFLFKAPFVAVPIYTVIGVAFWLHSRKAEKAEKAKKDEASRAATAQKEKGRLIIEEVSAAFIESAADGMTRMMFKYGLSCPKCGKLALPELDTKRNYTCYSCRTKFPSAIHNLTGSDVFMSPKQAIRMEVQQRGASLPDHCPKLEKADDEAWSLGWKKIGISIKKQK